MRIVTVVFSSILFFLSSACESVDMQENGSNAGNEENGSSEISLIRPSHYTLVWSDEFNQGATPNTKKWNYDIGSKLLGGTVWGNKERQYYTNEAKNAYIQNGKLIIQVLHTVHPSAPSGHNIIATSARIKSDTEDYYQAIGDTPYGFYEVRARLHCIPGAWPALWMLGQQGDWPARGELDIVEWSGRYHSQTVAQSAFHTSATQAGDIQENWKTQSLANMCNDYHLFQMHWTDELIIMGIDTKETLRFVRQSHYNSYQWPFTQPAFFIMNVAVGGNLGGDVDPTKIEDMKLEIDYVRVYK